MAPYGDIKIKGSNSEFADNDGIECALGGTDCLMTSKFPEGMEGFVALLNGETQKKEPVTSIPYEMASWGRHGLYPDLEDNTYKFYIYEKDDVLKLIATLMGALRNTLSVTGECVDLDADGLEVPFVENKIETKILIRQLNDLANDKRNPIPKPSASPVGEYFARLDRELPAFPYDVPEFSRESIPFYLERSMTDLKTCFDNWDYKNPENYQILVFSAEGNRNAMFAIRRSRDGFDGQLPPRVLATRERIDVPWVLCTEDRIAE